ncbi:MAG: universal stress protein [Alphaproteobacteria bacterium]|nr:universal stress protein [Alphaproteobacteria bacterium]
MIDESQEKQRAAVEANRTFLVVVDDSEEMQVALHFASRRAMRTGGRVALLYVQQPAEFQHWMAVGDLMREEAREEAEGLMQKLSAEVKEWSGNYPVVHMREGDVGEELEKLLGEEESISVLVLAASTDTSGPGPLISYLVGKGSARLRLPVTIVPGSLSDAEIIAIT